MKLTPDGESLLIHPARSCFWCQFRHVGRDCPSVRGAALAQVKLMCQGMAEDTWNETQMQRAANLAAAFDCLHFNASINW